MIPVPAGTTAARWRDDIPAIALLFAALVPSLPLLLLSGLYWDDYAWFWAYHQDGADALVDYMLQAAHPGYAPPMLAHFGLGGAQAGEVARGSALVFHLVNGLLLYRVLSIAAANRAVALLTAMLFLLSPLYTARVTLAHAFYDPFLSCYLASILLSDARRLWLRALGLLFLLFGLSLETLLVLELLRLAFLRQRRGNWRDSLVAAAPFWLICGFVAVSRFTWLVPYGTYGHYNAPNWDPATLFGLLGKHFEFYFPKAFKYITERTAALFGWPLLAVLFAVPAAAAAWLAGRPAVASVLPARPGWPWLCAVAAFGLLFVLVASLPYTLVGQVPKNNHFASHFTYPALAGGLLVWAALLLALPGLRLRAAAIVGIFCLFTLAKLQDAKWLFYDEAVRRDVLAQLHDSLSAEPEGQVVLLKLDRGSRNVMYRERCLSPQEFNVPLAALRAEDQSRSYVFDVDCGDLPQGDTAAVCSTSGHNHAPCPAQRRTLNYRLTPDFASHADVPLASLVTAATTPHPVAVGALVTEQGIRVTAPAAEIDGCLPALTAYATRFLRREQQAAACETPSGAAQSQ